MLRGKPGQVKYGNAMFLSLHERDAICRDVGAGARKSRSSLDEVITRTSGPCQIYRFTIYFKRLMQACISLAFVQFASHLLRDRSSVIDRQLKVRYPMAHPIAAVVAN